MKKSVLKIGFPKYLLLPAAGIFSLCITAHSQLSQTGLHAYFGIDGDTRSGHSKFGASISSNTGDDWFSLAGLGKGVIDTSNAAFYRSQLQAGRNITFMKNMSMPLYSKINNRLWLDAIYVRDYTSSSGKDSTAYGTGAKNGENPMIWSGRPESIPSKTDLVDAYAHMRRDGITINDSLWLYTGVSTISTNGDRYFDIELFKKETSYSVSSGRFTTAGLNDGRTEWIFDPLGNVVQTGDMIISVHYKAGQAPSLDIRIWVSRLTHQLTKPNLFKFGSSFDGGVIYGYASMLPKNAATLFGSGTGNYSNNAITDSTFSTPWGTMNTSGSWAERYAQLQFVEIGLNLTRMGIDPSLYAMTRSCDRLFHSLFFKSRSSNSFTANLQDFAGPVKFSHPAMDIEVVNRADTLTCNEPIAQLSFNPGTVGNYSWSTLDGHIVGYNEDSSAIQVKKKGSYFLTAQIAKGCATSHIEIFSVAVDSLPPIASADITLNAFGDVQLVGGDPIASNRLTPFGGSKGLEWEWRGPYGFESSEQNPIINGEWIWGSYYLNLKEKRNGCRAMAALDVSFGTASSGTLETEQVQLTKPIYLKTVNNRLYLVANQKHAGVAMTMIYSTLGELILKKDINLKQGINTIELPLQASGQVRIVSIYQSNKLSLTRKVAF